MKVIHLTQLGRYQVDRLHEGAWYPETTHNNPEEAIAMANELQMLDTEGRFRVVDLRA